VPRSGKSLVAVLAGLVLLAASGAAAAPRSAATAAASCPPPKYPGNGYFTSLSVKGVTCTTGKKVLMAHYRCRTRHGATGRCTTKVLSYSCSESRQSIPTEFDARVTCKRGSLRVIYTYQQNT
jgi:hypothetical protein